MTVQAFGAGGVPFMPLDSMNGGGRNSREDHKKVLDAWKSFKNNTKSIKEKYLKDRINSADIFLRRKVGGVGEEQMNPLVVPGPPKEGAVQQQVQPLNQAPSGEDIIEDEEENDDMYEDAEDNEDNEDNEDVEPVEPVESAEHAEYSEILNKLENMNHSINQLKEDVVHIKKTVGLGTNDQQIALDALDVLHTYVNDHAAKQLGGKKKLKSKKNKSKYGGEQGQYSLNIYGPEVGSSTTIKGGKKKGGTYVYASAEPLHNSYMIPTQSGGGKLKYGRVKRGGDLGFPGSSMPLNDSTLMTPDINAKYPVYDQPLPTGNISLGGSKNKSRKK